MTNKIQTVLPTGILAGIAATLLVLGANAQLSILLFVLYAASALPILVAGLGWGNRAAMIGILTASVLGAILVSPLFAFGMVIFTLAPAGWLSHLANLARPADELGGPDHLMAWYPISDILLHLCALVAIAAFALGVMMGYGPEVIDQAFDGLVAAIQAQEPTFTADQAGIAYTKKWLLLATPLVMSGFWVVLLFAAFYIAVRIVSRSGRALRPREDMPSALRMNRHAIFIFLAGIVMIFAGGIPALIGATICGTFGAGFVMAGFASIHFRTQGKSWRIPALVLCYMSSIVTLPAIAILILGLSDTRRTIALTPVKGANPPTTPEKNKID
ncbi:DUF2232 domain-containing protein [Neorhizobium tomejilense]|uniref:DUF2232 domain-containing protein n=1 Tax=Neorhizobium tomejilense TaxID=2093828 RepID=UPI003ECED609